MPEDSALKILFSIPQQQINQDLATADSNLLKIMQDIRAYRELPDEQQTPEQEAICYHNELLRDQVLRQRPNVPEDEGLYFIAWTAERIADEACFNANDKGRLAELGKQMDEIEKREGLSANEYFPVGTAPEDYQKIATESDAWFDKIEDLILESILKRYHCNQILDLFQHDRATYAVMREVGRRLVNSRMSETDKDDSKELDDHIANGIREKFGQPAFELLQRRLRAAGL